MTVTCGGQVVSEAIMLNHGTGPEAVDEQGTPILVEVRSETATGDRASLEALADGLRDCECGTEFLSLDALAAPEVQELVAELTAYMEANLTCPFEGGVGLLIQALNDKDVGTFLDKADECTWASGASWSDGLDEALSYFAEESFKKLSDYHVCNNDAMIQTEMWETFASTGNVPACDTASSMCSGPRWLYNP